MTDYSIWTLCFARAEVSSDFVGGSPVASNRGTVEIPMAFSVIASAPGNSRRLIAVDCGFRSGESMSGRKFANFEMPEAVLGKIGFSPAEVDTLVLTHLHFDHAGHLGAFPNAKIYVQRREHEQWRQVLREIPDLTPGKSLWALSSLNPDDFDVLDREIAGGRVHFLDGDADIAPGVSCRLAAESHTFGSQWIAVDTGSGPCVIAGDCVYSYANIERMWPPGYLQGNPWNLMRVFKQINSLVGGDLSRVVPGHDMGIFQRRPSWTLGRNPVAEVCLASGETSRQRR